MVLIIYESFSLALGVKRKTESGSFSRQLKTLNVVLIFPLWGEV